MLRRVLYFALEQRACDEGQARSTATSPVILVYCEP